jgi:hypothetical protein
MTMVTAVSYAHLNDDHDEVTYHVYTVPSEDYRQGMSETRAAELSTRDVKYQDAPGFRGVENVKRDGDGNPITHMVSCGLHTWNDALITDRTPVPSGRCPWEHLHELSDETETVAPTYEQGQIDRIIPADATAEVDYRLKIWGPSGETKTLSITPAQLAAIRAILGN